MPNSVQKWRGNSMNFFFLHLPPCHFVYLHARTCTTFFSSRQWREKLRICPVLLVIQAQGRQGTAGNERSQLIRRQLREPLAIYMNYLSLIVRHETMPISHHYGGYTNFRFRVFAKISHNYQFRVSLNFPSVSRNFRETQIFNLGDIFKKFEGNFSKHETGNQYNQLFNI